MMSANILAQLVKKWQRVAAIGKNRLTWFSSKSVEETEGSCGMSCSSVAGKGYCIVYTTDDTRFEVSLAFLGTTVFSDSCGCLKRSSASRGLMVAESR